MNVKDHEEWKDMEISERNMRQLATFIIHFIVENIYEGDVAYI